MRRIRYGNRDIHYDVKRGKRKKTVAIHVDADTVTIMAPKRLAEDEIRQIIEKKARWIYERQERIRADSLNHIGKKYVSGEHFPYLGRQYCLEVIERAGLVEPVCKRLGGCLQVSIRPDLRDEPRREAVKRALNDWYRKRAEIRIRERIPFFAGQLGVFPQSIRIKEQKTQWGSCSRSGSVRFNWKIIMAPQSIVDYVIVHELCHLIYNHHQTQFWEEVESVIPDYEVKKGWLREHNFIINALS
ncbi:MAG: M48 family metallopeptidase [Deltaproteobacteria bacterium]|nr:M48 family metallopeptidase [Deltaproteobacteria bacterium]